jgi:carbon monoxide dehydrogenase subunit G
MIFEHRVAVDAPSAKVWGFVQDVQKMSTCVPGLESVVEDGAGAYTGALKVAVGPIAVRLEGKLRVAGVDSGTRTTRLEVEATDRRIRSSVRSATAMTVVGSDGQSCELHVRTDAAVMGKLGQFGQAVLRKKTEQLLRQFAENVALALDASTAERSRAVY